MYLDSTKKITKEVKYFTILISLSLFLPPGIGIPLGNLMVLDRRIILIFAIILLQKKTNALEVRDNHIKNLFLLFLFSMLLSFFSTQSYTLSILNFVQFIIFSGYIGYLVFKKFNPDDFDYFIRGIIISFAFISVIIISERAAGYLYYQEFLHRYLDLNFDPYSFSVRLSGLRAEGPFRHPIFASINLAAVASMTLVKLIFEKTGKGKITYTFSLFLNLAAIYMTISRGGVITFLISALFLFSITIKLRQTRKVAMYLGLIIILLVISIPKVRQELFILTVGGIYPQLLDTYSYQESQAWNLEARQKNSLDIVHYFHYFRDITKLTGIGTGVLINPGKTDIFISNYAILYMIMVYPFYLTIFIETGIIGIAAFIALFAYACFKLLRIYSYKIPKLSITSLAILGFVISYLLGWLSVNYPLEGQLLFPLLAFCKFSKESQMIG